MKLYVPFLMHMSYLNTVLFAAQFKYLSQWCTGSDGCFWEWNQV